MSVVALLANGILQQIVQPIAFGATLSLNPLVVLVSTIGGGCLFGMLGLVLAAPLVSAAVSITATSRAHGPRRSAKRPLLSHPLRPARSRRGARAGLRVEQAELAPAAEDRGAAYQRRLRRRAIPHHVRTSSSTATPTTSHSQNPETLSPPAPHIRA